MSLLVPGVVIFEVSTFAVNDMWQSEFYKNLTHLTSAVYKLAISRYKKFLELMRGKTNMPKHCHPYVI